MITIPYTQKSSEVTVCAIPLNGQNPELGFQQHRASCKQPGIAAYDISTWGSAVTPGFDLARIEERLSAPIQFPHRHRFYQVVWITRGTGTHIIDGKSYAIDANAIFALAPGRVHSCEIENHGSVFAGYAINFSADFLHMALRAGQSWFCALNDPRDCPVLYLNSDQSAILLDTVARLESEYRGNGWGRADFLRAHLQLFLMQLRRYRPAIHPDSGPSASATLVQKFRLLVDQDLSRGERVKDYASYASLLHVTESHLIEVTKRVTGVTPGQLIREHILLEAKRLLIHSGSSIAEVAYRLGFDDPSYFSRFFRKGTNHSPKEFKGIFEKSHRAAGERDGFVRNRAPEDDSGSTVACSTPGN